MRRASRQYHRRFWLIGGILLPIAFLAILAVKQTVPNETPAVLLEAPK